jgi:hypothetical protein
MRGPRPSFDKSIENDEWKRPAVQSSHRAYMRDNDNGIRHDQKQSASTELPDFRTTQLLSIAREQRRKREEQEQRSAAGARGAVHPLSLEKQRESIRARDAMPAQGTLATEIGLVSSSRRRPFRRAEPHASSFGFVSRRMHEESERSASERVARAVQHNAAIREQSASDRLSRQRNKDDARVERMLQEELNRREKDRLDAIREEKMSQLRAEGVKDTHIALLAKMAAN